MLPPVNEKSDNVLAGRRNEKWHIHKYELTKGSKLNSDQRNEIISSHPVKKAFVKPFLHCYLPTDLERIGGNCDKVQNLTKYRLKLYGPLWKRVPIMKLQLSLSVVWPVKESLCNCSSIIELHGSDFLVLDDRFEGPWQQSTPVRNNIVV